MKNIILALVVCVSIIQSVSAFERPCLEIITHEVDSQKEANGSVMTSVGIRNHPQPILNFNSLSEEGNINFQVCSTDGYGELEDLLGENIYNVDWLVVKGLVGHEDLKTMWKASFDGKLKVINLESAEIEGNSIPDNAFFYQEEQLSPDGLNIACIQLRRIIFPNTLEKIGDGAFSYAIRLEDINFPASLKEFGEYAFADCIRLKMNPLTIPEGIEEIPNMCFMNCSSLAGEVKLPSSIRRIGEGAFYQSKISSINFPEGLETLEQAGFYATALKEVILPKSCLNFPGSAHFQLCMQLNKIYLPEGMTVIPSSFLYACMDLEEVTIPSSVREIKNSALELCTSIKQLILPEGLERIGKSVLKSLNSLETIVFPSTLVSLGAESCRNWASIKQISSKAVTPPVCEESQANPSYGPFGMIDSDAINDTPVYIPVDTSDAYRDTWGWNCFSNFIETDKFPTSSVESIDLKANALKSDEIYDLSGRKICNPKRGEIYIKNGNKYVFKN